MHAELYDKGEHELLEEPDLESDEVGSEGHISQGSGIVQSIRGAICASAQSGPDESEQTGTQLPSPSQGMAEEEEGADTPVEQMTSSATGPDGRAQLHVPSRWCLPAIPYTCTP